MIIFCLGRKEPGKVRNKMNRIYLTNPDK
jgi:hypothetical protein